MEQDNHVERQPVERVVCGPFQTNTYVLFLHSQRGAIVVDPGPGSFEQVVPILKKKKLSLLAIWLTHSHWDHTADCAEFLKHWNVPLLVHEADAANLLHPGHDGLPSWIPIAPVTPSGYLHDGDVLEDLWTVIHTPGHSLGSVCFYRDGILISGDTLFRGTMGNISFPLSSPMLMGESLLRLSALPGPSRVLPGHGPETTIEQERPWMIVEADLLTNPS